MPNALVCLNTTQFLVIGVHMSPISYYVVYNSVLDLHVSIISVYIITFVHLPILVCHLLTFILSPLHINKRIESLKIFLDTLS